MPNYFRVIEIGGTNTRRADVEFLNDVYEVRNFQLKENVLWGQDVAAEILKYAQNDLGSARAILFLVAGPVKEHRIVAFMPNLSQFPKNLDLARIISERLNIPAFVFNDMEAATVGMAYLIKNKWSKPFWGVTWSTGIGGRFWDGKQVAAPEEIGHLPFDLSPSAPLCGCGQKGHADALLGGRAVSQRLKELFPNEMANQKDACQILYDKTKQREEWALKFYLDLAQKMGKFLAKILEIHPAELICFKGTFAASALSLPEIRNEIMTSIRDNLSNPDSVPKELIFSPEPEKDSFIGAAILAKNLL